jgi:uncharacterized membrane protein
MHASVPLSRAAVTRQRALWALGAITMAGLILRTAWAAQQPLWSDEALTLVIAKWPVQDLLARPIDPTPGLYYLLHKWLIPDDAGVAVIRGISIIAGTLSIPVMYAIGALGISRAAGLLAAALLALSPVLVDYSQEARTYALQIFFVLLSAAGLLAWTKRLGSGGGGFGLATFGIATVLAFSAHLASIFWVIPAVPLACWVTFRRGTPFQKRLFLACLALMALGAGLEAQRLIWRVSLGGGFNWLAQATPVDALATWGRVLLPLGPFGARATMVVVLLAAFAFIGWRIAANIDEWRSWSREHEAVVGVIAIMVLAPIGVWLLGFVLVPIFMPRTILITIPGFILLVVLLVHLERKPWFALVPLLLFGLSLLVTGPVRQKENWRAVAAALRKDVRPGDAIIACPEWKYPALRHAITPPLNAPIVTTLGYQMLLMDTSVGHDQAWTQRFFSIFVEPPMRLRMHQRATVPVRAKVMSPFRRAWFVESECGGDQDRSVRSWLGQGRWTLVLASAGTLQHAAIRLWRFDGEQSDSRRMLSPDPTISH